ncbi:DUF433 domain-containing protein [Telluribacter sp. SYSU D00476]|uniref:DUF433 domain-containing protein n=1 Tax=Telluribacter sp. SYSU D00476 TaxID=2811430 RepID=UPI001FF1EAD9|nr:DUF433 domain-containing protein [Telluribacter sp. SYSU D00476]
MDDLLKRITLNPDICHGVPTLRNKRYPVFLILDLLSAGETWDTILNDYPALERDDIKACLRYASQITQKRL